MEVRIAIRTKHGNKIRTSNLALNNELVVIRVDANSMVFMDIVLNVALAFMALYPCLHQT